MNKAIVFKLWKLSDYQDSDAKNEIDNFAMEQSSSNKKFWNENCVKELNSLFSQKTWR